MFRDLYRSRPHLGMIYVAMKSLRSIKLLWWKLPHDPARGGARWRRAHRCAEVPAAIKQQAYRQLYRGKECQQ